MSVLDVYSYLPVNRQKVLSVLREAAQSGLPGVPPSVMPEPGELAEWFDSQEGSTRLVAEMDGDIVGFVQVGVAAPRRTDRDPDRVPGGDLAGAILVGCPVVLPGQQGSGVFEALLRAAAAAVWRRGFRPVSTVPATHGDVAEIYQREGWETLDTDGSDVIRFCAPVDRSGVTGFVHTGVRDGGVGSVATGIEVSTTFVLDHPGQYGEFAYARSQNPTRKALEEALAVSESARHAMAFSSGLAAIDTVLRLLAPGERVLIGQDAYGGTWRLLDKVWSRVAVGVDIVDVTDPRAVDAAWTPQTRMLLVETPSNPTLAIADIRALADVAHAHAGLLVVDNTFATPWLQRPLALGADVVVHSATKYLGGHSDVVAGALAVDDDELATEFRFSQKAIGAVPGPFDSFLVLRGLRTLPLRMERHCENARAVAFMLAEHPAVDRVFYPGLPDHPGFEVASSQMRAPGGMVSFTLKGGELAAVETAKRTRVFTLAESLGAVESLIEHPASMTHVANNGSLLAVDPALLRLSVGIEDSWALLADLRQALPSAG